MFPDHRPRSFLDPQAVARLAAIPLCARWPMLGSVSGRHPSPHRGASVEFAEYRKYVPGDDLRRLDWRAYGRSDRFYLKEFEADTNLRCCVVLDTSDETPRALRGELSKLFSVSEGGNEMLVHIISFGFKHGMPADVDYVFDVRYLRNPHHDPQLRPFTGDDPRVRAYVEEDPRTAEVRRRLCDFMDFVLPQHAEEGRRYVSIGVGCTGGKHRSRVVAAYLAEHLERNGYRVVRQHRDRYREGQGWG